MSETPNNPNPSQPTNPVTPGTPVSGMGDPADVEKNKVMAILSYLGILVIIPILMAKESPFAKYHANQGLMLAIVAIALGFILGIASIIVAFIPVLNVVSYCFGCFLTPCFLLAYLAFVIMGIMNCVNGKLKPLPLFPAITLIK